MKGKEVVRRQKQPLRKNSPLLGVSVLDTVRMGTVTPWATPSLLVAKTSNILMNVILPFFFNIQLWTDNMSNWIPWS